MIDIKIIDIKTLFSATNLSRTVSLRRVKPSAKKVGQISSYDIMIDMNKVITCPTTGGRLSFVGMILGTKVRGIK